MTKIAFTALSIILLNPVFSQTLLKQDILKKDYFPETVPVMGEHLHISTTEVSNSHYLEFVDWLYTKGRMDEYNRSLPDTAGWKNGLAYNEPLVTYYFRHPAYRDYPVVNISQQQAIDFCSWVADRIMETEDFKKSPIEKIRVRLPSEKEWMTAARLGLPENSVFPWEEKGVRKASPKKHQGESLGNFKWGNSDNAGIAGKLSDRGFITTPVKSYWPNPAGIYNMAGNVAEWIEEPCRSKGGSWNQPPYNARIDEKGIYDGSCSARSDIGFRYVIEVISLKGPSKAKVYKLDAKQIEKQLVYIPDTVPTLTFASAYETPNWLYKLFLAEHPGTACQPADSNWLRYFRYNWYREYHKHPFYDEYPVVNISYDAAQKFCEWLTTRYNTMPDRKYKKVEFYLPSPSEWEQAVHGGRDYSDYPWGGPYTRNSKGCYLANFCPLEEQYLHRDSTGYYKYKYPDGDLSLSRRVDGATTIAPVYSYFPNDYGLYCGAGNVAEMTSVRGISKGGSWVSNQYHIKIGMEEDYTRPDVTLGFRYMMKVIEK